MPESEEKNARSVVEPETELTGPGSGSAAVAIDSEDSEEQAPAAQPALGQVTASVENPAEEAKLEEQPAEQSGFVTGQDTDANRFEQSRSGREMNVSTLIHLMGVPTQQQVDVVERKIDALANKVTTLTLRLDRLSRELGSAQYNEVIERIDAQIADLRQIIRKVLPRALVAESDSLPQVEKKR